MGSAGAVGEGLETTSLSIDVIQPPLAGAFFPSAPSPWYFCSAS